MNQQEINLIEQQCARLLIAFSNLNDSGDHEEMVLLFTENAGFARPSDPDVYAVGRDKILSTFKARPKDRITRHLLSNILINVESEDTAMSSCYVVLYTASLDNKALELGLQANPSQLIGQFEADFSKTQEGWKISRLTGEIILGT